MSHPTLSRDGLPICSCFIRKRRVDVPWKPVKRQARTQIDSFGAPGDVFHEVFLTIPLALLLPERISVVVVVQSRLPLGFALVQSPRPLMQIEL